MVGLNISAKQFVQKLKSEMPDVQLITDASSTAEQGQDLVAAGTNPNPYDGMLGTIDSDGLRALEQQEQAAAAVRGHLREGDRNDREGPGRRSRRGPTARPRSSTSQ